MYIPGALQPTAIEKWDVMVGRGKATKKWNENCNDNGYKKIGNIKHANADVSVSVNIHKNRALLVWPAYIIQNKSMKKKKNWSDVLK